MYLDLKVSCQPEGWYSNNGRYKSNQDIKAGKIEYRLDKTNIIHVPVGKASFTEEQLADNFQTLIDAINKAKPAAVKGQYLKDCNSYFYNGTWCKDQPNEAGISISEFIQKYGLPRKRNLSGEFWCEKITPK